MTKPNTIAQAASALSRGARIVDRLNLDFGDCRIAVESNSQALLNTLANYFDGFLAPRRMGVQMTVTAIEAEPPELGLELTPKEPEPGKSKIKEEYLDLPDGRLVRKRLTGMVFAFGADTHLAVGPCRANDNQVINFINNRMIQFELDHGCLLAHAAGISHRGRGMALAGFSGMGKSTLALHMMSLGADFVSNDRLMIKRRADGAHMTGVAKLPRINPGTALNNPDLAGVMSPEDHDRFAALPPEELWPLEHKYDVDIEACFGPGRFNLNSPMNALGLLNWRHGGGELSIEPVDIAQRLDLLEAFKKSPGAFYLEPAAPRDFSDQVYVRALEGVRVYELSGGADFERAARACLDLLARGA